MRKILIWLILGIIAINIVTAITIYPIVPDQNGTYITNQNKELIWYITSTSGVANCTTTIDGVIQTTNTNNYTAITLRQKYEVAQGSHTESITCTDTTGTSTQDTKTFNTNTALNFEKQGNDEYNLKIAAILTGIITILVFMSKKKFFKVILSITLVICTIYLKTQVQNDIMYIPIILAILLTIYEALK